MHFINIKPLSINETYKVIKVRGKYLIGTSPTYKSFKNEIQFLLPNDIVVDYNNIKIDVIVYFKNSRSDIDNPLKSFIDSLQEKYAFNDKDIYEINIKKEVVKDESKIGFKFNISKIEDK